MCWRGVAEERARSDRESHPTRMHVGAPLARAYYIMLQMGAVRRGGEVGLGYEGLRGVWNSAALCRGLGHVVGFSFHDGHGKMEHVCGAMCR